MRLQRSKTAPQPLVTLPAPNLSRSFSYQNLSPKFGVAPSQSPAAFPRVVDKDDPFNLTGFFPCTIGSAEEEDEWNWLRNEEDVNRPNGLVFGMDTEDVATYTPAGSMPVSEFVEDELMKQAIKGEDKLGVLSLDKFFGGTGPERYPSEDRLFSPYFGDEPVDHDSLYLSHCAQREYHSQVVKVDTRTSFDELFLVPWEKEASIESSHGLLRAFLYELLE